MESITGFLTNNEKQTCRLNKLIDPLRIHFGIDVFWFNTTNEDGHHTSISSYHEPYVSFYHKDWIQNAQNFVSPPNMKSGCTMLGQAGNFKNFQDDLQEKYPIHHPMIITRKESEKKAHVFGFASKKFNPTLPSIYVNHLPLLNKFLDYFLKENERFQTQSEKVAINLAEIRGPTAFYGRQLDKEGFLNTERNSRFLRDLGVDSSLLNAVEMLSPRQKQVLAACVDGKTAAQTADEIMLSTRTVQHYLDYAKDKLGLNTKAELIQCGLLLKLAGLLNV